MKHDFDLLIIGAGPGGYVAAIRAAQLGLKTAIVEKSELGGVCLNWGCIPSKNLIHQANTFHSLTEMEAVGVKIERSNLDYTKVYEKSRQVVKTLTGGVAHLLKKNKVEVIKGTAKITGRKEVTVHSEEADEFKITAKNLLIATGSRPMQVPGFECNEQQVLSSNGILALKQLPQSLVILGAGAIGCEFAYVMNSFGVKVTLIEAAEHILPSEDFETTAVLAKSLKRDGIEVLEQSRALSLEKTDHNVIVTVDNINGQQQIIAEKVLVVFGRVPNTEGLGLIEMGVKLDERGYVISGDYGETHSAGIYAIGDITSTPALAHVASKEGELAVEKMAGHHSDEKTVNLELVPSAIYCEPQVAGFGLQEEQAKKAGIKVKKSTFAYTGAGKTIAIGKPEGLVKVLCDAQTNEILGGHIVGHNATELIHELLLAKNAELLPVDIANMIHAHPTISETIMEVMRGIDGEPIHG